MSIRRIARQLSAVSRHAQRSLGARLLDQAPRGRRDVIPSDVFRQGIASAANTLPEDLLRGHHYFRVPADRPPWFDTGIDVEAGESLSWLANGRVYLSKVLDLFVEPNFQLWARIGDGPVFRSTRETFTFQARSAGRLQLASYFPGQWADRDGRLDTPESAYRGLAGGIDVALMRWRGEAGDGLARLREFDASGLAAAEIERLESAPSTPAGWEYLWFLGPGEIYSLSDDSDGRRMHCDTHCDVGILRHPVDVPLQGDTTLRWSWNVESLPSAIVEDSLPTHDYMSIAVEYENGIDVTYYWSAELGVDEGYWCPLPAWKSREFHIVVRSGSAGLGEWIDEERNLYADYRRYLGKPPSRIVRIWLIANSIFQRGHGRCAYRRISVGHSGARVALL